MILVIHYDNDYVCDKYVIIFPTGELSMNDLYLYAGHQKNDFIQAYVN